MCPYFWKPLSSGKHNDQVNIVAIFNGPGKLVRVGARVVYINLDDVQKLIFLREEGLFHSGKLSGEMAQAFTHVFPLYGHHLGAICELPVRCMNMYVDRHVLSFRALLSPHPGENRNDHNLGFC